MNTIGHVFRVLSYGESHGPVVGCVIEGCPAGLTLNLREIQDAVNRRKTAQTAFSSSRKEDDPIEMLSGVYNNITLGSPIAIQIKNSDAHSSDYEILKDVYRPGHADYTYHVKYGLRDHRGGGRSSIRITAPLVAAGDVARQLLQSLHVVDVKAYVIQLGDIRIPLDASLSLEQIYENEFRCPHAETAQRFNSLIEKTKVEGETLGGIIQCTISGLPAGIGEPVFQKLHAQLGHAMLNINTVKGVEFGDGFAIASLRGSDANDIFRFNEKGVYTETNHSGGLLGGISNGQPISFNVAFKPISSIQKTQQTITTSGEQVDLRIGGRHDVCAVPRAVPIVEAYTNILLADNILLSRLNKL